MNPELPTETWQAHLDAFRDDIVAALEAGPLEHIANLNTIITDALIRTGLPGVFALLDEYRRRLEQAETDRDHFLKKSSGPPNGACAKCGEDNPSRLLTPPTTCTACYLETFKKLTNKKAAKNPQGIAQSIQDKVRDSRPKP